MVAIIANTARVEVDTAVYSIPALKKAAYRLADRCTVIFGVPNGSVTSIEILFGEGTPEESARETIRAFFEESLDYDLRERIAAETAPVRNLILAHAFSRTKMMKSSGG